MELSKHVPTDHGRPGPVATSEPPAVELDGIAHRFGRRWVLRGVSLRVRRGEAVALLGANGSGKTTLLKVAATALRPTRGGGRVCGLDMTRERDQIRGRVAYLGHAAALYDDLTAFENLRFAQRMLGLPRDRDAIVRTLESVGLGAFADERVRGFSAGMRRRLGLARLELREADLLLLDEPFSSLDAAGVDRMNDALRAALARGAAAVIVTHDPGRLRGIAGRAVELRSGRAYAVERWNAVVAEGAR